MTNWLKLLLSHTSQKAPSPPSLLRRPQAPPAESPPWFAALKRVPPRAPSTTFSNIRFISHSPIIVQCPLLMAEAWLVWPWLFEKSTKSFLMLLLLLMLMLRNVFFFLWQRQSSFITNQITLNLPPIYIYVRRTIKWDFMARPWLHLVHHI